MMPPEMPPPPPDAQKIDELVEHFRAHAELFGKFGEMLVGVAATKDLKALYHSLRWRVKDPEHLRDKLVRKGVAVERGGQRIELTQDNLFHEVNDLVGLRILHLHTSEFPSIDRALREALAEYNLPILEGPKAKVWDIELRNYFESIGVPCEDNRRMYSSVHYVIQANQRTKLTAEIQVRTLAEEVWGEVDHAINYPHESPKLACREQIKVLARVTSSCTRLVDAIFATHNEGPPA